MQPAEDHSVEGIVPTIKCQLAISHCPMARSSSVKAVLPEDKGPKTRPNCLTRKPKRAFIVPIHKKPSAPSARFSTRRFPFP